MTKAELVEFVREKTGLRKVDVANAVAAVLDGVKETLVKGGKVQIVGFGTFEVRKRSARTGRNPQDPTKIVKIPEKIVPVFKAGKLLREAVDVTVKKSPRPSSRISSFGRRSAVPRSPTIRSPRCHIVFPP